MGKFAMWLARVGPIVPIAGVGLALCLLALAPLGWRLGWWPYRFALLRMMPASGAVAAVAVVLALVTLAVARSSLGLRRLAALLIVLAAGAGLVYLPLRYAYLLHTLPPINDVTTDADARPPFDAVRAARAAERRDRRDVSEPRLSQLQKVGYPDLAPVRTPRPVGEAFSAALAVAQAMPGWTIVAVDEGRGRIEASERSRWFGFTDDIVIRVAADDGGSRIDMRSASRKGSSDLGVNAARIRDYMGALRGHLG